MHLRVTFKLYFCKSTRAIFMIFPNKIALTLKISLPEWRRQHMHSNYYLWITYSD